MVARIIQLRDAVVASIAAAAIDGVTPAAAIMPIIEPADLGDGLRCEVLPMRQATKPESRSTNENHRSIQIVIQKRVIDIDTEIPALIETVDQIIAAVTNARRLPYGNKDEYATVAEVRQEPLYDREDLKENSVFASSVVVVFADSSTAAR